MLPYILHGKRNFINVIELRILSWGNYPGLSDNKEAVRVTVRESDMRMEAEKERK